MDTDWWPIVAVLGGLGGFVGMSVWLVRRSERRLNGGSGVPQAPVAPGTGDRDEVRAYLDRMAGELALPAGDVAEVRAELADHLRDSIATLEADGFAPEDAVREALGRLGPPTELGRQIRTAHQSTRRLLAGAGGGVFAAGGGFVVGYLGGFAVAVAVALVIAGAASGLSLVGIRPPDLTSQDHGNTVNSLLIAVSLVGGAATSTRYAVRTSAGLSRRLPQSLAIFWAAAGALLFGWLALFGTRGPQSWPSVAASLSVPVVAVAAARIGVDRPMPHVARWAVGVGLVTVLATTFLLVAVSESGPVGSVVLGNGRQPDLHLDVAAPAAPTEWLPNGQPLGIGWGGESSSTALLVTSVVSTDGSASADPDLANWRDLRFEAWHALLDDPAAGYGIDPRYSGPFDVQPAVAAAFGPPGVGASFHLERIRSGSSWWILLTGVAPNGQRYRLSDGSGGSTQFSGSAWDWLTAPQ